jgi:hypothetical protein
MNLTFPSPHSSSKTSVNALMWERVLSGFRREAGEGVCSAWRTLLRSLHSCPLTRLDFVLLDLATLSHKGRGKGR